MKKHITAGVVRSLMLLFSCVFALGAYAENSITIENVTLNSTTPINFLRLWILLLILRLHTEFGASNMGLEKGDADIYK